MKIAHVREMHAPAGTPWRLAAALDPGETPASWIDLEAARRAQVEADPRLAHNAALYRQPLTTLDEVLARGLRVSTLGVIAEGSSASALLDAAELAFGPPVLQPPSLR